LRLMLAKLFSRNGYEVTQAQNDREAIEYLEKGIFDLVLTDLRLGVKSGLDILAVAKQTHSETEVIIMTAFASVETAVLAIQNGASDYITKPFKTEEILFKANKALERIGLKSELRNLRQQVAHHFGFDNIIGTSKSINELKKVIGRITTTDIAVMITGESGTGKELLAKVIHHHSPRREKPFVTINCSAIPENLMESELFGHVKGAFTSANANKRGLFEEADRGTIFLDEIGDLPYSIQAKLLRVLQEMEIRPVGGTVTKSINVRVIAATNADLPRRVSEGRFREDLYYRLNVMPLHIPPLRERLEDIPALTEYFLRKIQREYNQPAASLTPDGLEQLLHHDWPGNVRELENTLKRAVALSGGRPIRGADIVFIAPHDKHETAQAAPPAAGRSLEDSQRIQILKSLQENDWNYSLTASQLGIGRTTLWRKVKKYELRQTGMAIK